MMIMMMNLFLLQRAGSYVMHDKLMLDQHVGPAHLPRPNSLGPAHLFHVLAYLDLFYDILWFMF